MPLPFSLSRPQCCRHPLTMASGSTSLIWFRKGLRIHDNPALEYASKGSKFVYPVFVIDPHYMEPDPKAFTPGSTRAGLNRIRFLLESLVDLDLSLKKLGSRLLVLKGEPSQVLIRCLKEVSASLPLSLTIKIWGCSLILLLLLQWDVKKLCFEFDTDPYYQALDVKVKVSYKVTFPLIAYSMHLLLLDKNSLSFVRMWSCSWVLDGSEIKLVLSGLCFFGWNWSVLSSESYPFQSWGYHTEGAVKVTLLHSFWYLLGPSLCYFH